MNESWPSVENAQLVQATCGAILQACDPAPAVTRYCATLDSNGLPISLLGIGKAAVPMTRAALDALGDRASEVLVLTTGHPDAGSLSERAEILVGDHPLATERNTRNANRLLEYLQGSGGNDRILLVLLSGGGSALTTRPAAGLTLEDITRVSSLLMRRGCPIDELNCVRKHCERLKGGRMAALNPTRRTMVCVLSDVIGEPISTIASGPFAPDPTTYADAMNVLAKYDATHESGGITEYLRAGMEGKHEETPKPGDPLFDRVSHEIVLNNPHATLAAREALCEPDRIPTTLSAHTGSAQDAAHRLTHALGDHHAVVMGGEPVVGDVPEGSLGGPMQEAVLATALELESDLFDWLVVGFATDGRDGPTDAAGAAIDRAMLARARDRGLPLEEALGSHDTHRVLSDMDALIRTGPTGTNVNDVLFAIRR